jgi:hypothetical protein
MGFFSENSRKGLFLAALGAVAILVSSIQAQQPGEAQTTVIMEPMPLLPAHLPGLTLGESSSGAADAATAGAFGGMACGLGSGGDGTICSAALKEDGLSRFAGGKYSPAAGGSPLDVLALEFNDATGAYSAYTFYRSMMKAPKVVAGDARSGHTSETTVDSADSLAWAGTAVVRVNGHADAKALQTIVSSMPKVGGRRGLAPLLPTYLPAKGLSAATVRYALGPIAYKAMGGVLPPAMLDWSKSAETLAAEYVSPKGGHDKGLLHLLMYPTPQIAGERGRAVEAYINGNDPAHFGTVKLRRVGPLLGLTMGALQPEYAQELVSALHLSQEVTFDKPMPLEFHAEIRKTATLLQTIAVFCGISILAAVVLGVFLGGARAGIRVLQGKPAASEPEFLTIDLRDRPKGLFAGKDGIKDEKARL